jgi:hypothetical protein
MMNFMFILMLLMALMMNPWLVPIAFVLWIAVKYVKRMSEAEVKDKEDTTIYL